jgi:hypothetical protein
LGESNLGNQRSIFPPKPNQTECDRFAFNSEWRCSVTNKITNPANQK